MIAALWSDAVQTPPLLARALLDLLPVEVWTNPHFRWLDPATKSGSILREAARRLMDGLTEWQPDRNKRAEHILRTCSTAAPLSRSTGECPAAFGVLQPRCRGTGDQAADQVRAPRREPSLRRR